MRANAPSTGSGVRLLEGLLGLDASDTDADISDKASNLNLNWEDRDGVEGAVTMDLALMVAQKRI